MIKIGAARTAAAHAATEEDQVACGNKPRKNVFCNEDGRQYSSDALNWRFSKMTQAGRHRPLARPRSRHTAVSIMSSNGVPLQEISDTVGHKSTHVTETVYRHVIVPAIRGGAAVMDSVFGNRDSAADDADE